MNTLQEQEFRHQQGSLVDGKGKRRGGDTGNSYLPCSSRTGLNANEKGEKGSHLTHFFEDSIYVTVKANEVAVKCREESEFSVAGGHSGRRNLTQVLHNKDFSG